MRHFTDFFAKLRQDLNQAHEDRRQFCEDTRAHVQEMAQRVRSELAEFADDLRGAQSAFRGGR
jgi:hypothetical protein